MFQAYLDLHPDPEPQNLSPKPYLDPKAPTYLVKDVCKETLTRIPKQVGFTGSR